MKLRLERAEQHPEFTIGQLYVDGHYECWVLEDMVRAPGVKVPGETAIPEGDYRVVVDYSTRFKRPMPHILDVPGFEGIRIHSGNVVADTEGCLLVGCDRVGGSVQRSREAYAALLPKLVRAIEAGEEVWIAVVRSAEAAA
jgi:hypothetical protein